MKKISFLLIIGLLGAGISSCVVYDDGYDYGAGPDVDLSFWNGRGAAWYGGGWYGGDSWGSHHHHHHGGYGRSGGRGHH